MAKISAAADHALSVIAHVAMAGDISTKVDGLEGFHEAYLKSLSSGDKAIYQRFKTLYQKARIDFLGLIEQDMKTDGK